MTFTKPYHESFKDGRVYHNYLDRHTAEAYKSDYLVAGWKYHDNECAFSLVVRVYPVPMSASGWAQFAAQ